MPTNTESILGHAKSFANINDVIRVEANAALQSIEEHLEAGYTKQDIVDEWNQFFESEDNKFKDFDELEEWLITIGI